MLRDPSMESHCIPRKVKLVFGVRLYFGQLIRNPDWVNRLKAISRLLRQMLKDEPRMRVSSK